MSPDRPLMLIGWDPRGRPLRPQQFRDRETAAHVAALLRTCGFRVTLIVCVSSDAPEESRSVRTSVA